MPLSLRWMERNDRSWLFALSLRTIGVADVRPVEARGKDAGVVELQAVDEVVPRLRIGRRRQRHARHAREALLQQRELQIFGPEVMAPLANAMGFVDGKQPDPDARQKPHEPVADQTFRRHIEKVYLARHQRIANVARLIRWSASS